jgi:hypothetical protein
VPGLLEAGIARDGDRDEAAGVEAAVFVDLEIRQPARIFSPAVIDEEVEGGAAIAPREDRQDRLAVETGQLEIGVGAAAIGRHGQPAAVGDRDSISLVLAGDRLARLVALLHGTEGPLRKVAKNGAPGDEGDEQQVGYVAGIHMTASRIGALPSGGRSPGYVASATVNCGCCSVPMAASIACM